jgi:hypothetical protein
MVLRVARASARRFSRHARTGRRGRASFCRPPGRSPSGLAACRSCDESQWWSKVIARDRLVEFACSPVKPTGPGSSVMDAQAMAAAVRQLARAVLTRACRSALARGTNALPEGNVGGGPVMRNPLVARPFPRRERPAVSAGPRAWRTAVRGRPESSRSSSRPSALSMRPDSRSSARAWATSRSALSFAPARGRRLHGFRLRRSSGVRTRHRAPFCSFCDSGKRAASLCSIGLPGESVGVRHGPSSI